MSKLVQRAVALVVMVAVVMGATVWGTISTTIHYKNIQSDAPVVMTVNGDEVKADEYAGYMLYNMMYYANMYAQFGMSNMWDNEETAAMFGPAMPSAAQEQAVYARVVMQHFNDLGLQLTYSQEQEMAQLRQDSIDMMGYDNYINQIASFGFSDDTYSNFMYISQCYQALNDYYFGENGVSVPSDEELMQYFRDNYLSAKHILICLTDPTTGETLRTDEEAKALAQDILDRINAGEDFDTLMNEYSEDPGLSGNPDGYIFTEGEMIDEFYQGAAALEEGEVSGLVKSDYGYHIIKREPLDYEGQLENYRSVLTSLTAGTMDDLVQQWMDEADVQTTDVYDEVTYQNVHDYLPADVQEILNAAEAAEQDAAQAAEEDAAVDAASGQEAADADSASDADTSSDIGVGAADGTDAAAQ